MKSKSQGASAPIVSLAVRCRKGDLAILLTGPFAGCIVDVIEYHGVIELSDGKVLVDAWLIRHETDEPDTDYFKEDKYLLPIRPGDLDETEADGLGQKVGDVQGVRHG